MSNISPDSTMFENGIIYGISTILSYLICLFFLPKFRLKTINISIQTSIIIASILLAIISILPHRQLKLLLGKYFEIGIVIFLSFFWIGMMNSI